ncbi:MAG: 5-oxoprolinase, partial [Cyanobacteria bacterium HKST-UBA01]|nr:5-oxoprolinase [Cyanobacteria bacterium HKST-UBA01]
MSDLVQKHWQFWIDRGGTFTDIVALRNDGLVSIKKLLSEDPAHYEDAAREGIERILKSDSPVESVSIKQIKMGTTVATNALLERKGVPTMLVVNQGFADILRIGYQARPDLFARNIRLPENLYCRVAELKGRLDATGKIIEPLDADEVRTRLKEAQDAGIESLAIVFMHSYLNDVHERQCLDIAQQFGFKSIALSSRTSPLIKIVFRGDTTVADAYLSPVLNRYIDRFTNSFSNREKTRIYFMQSNGGLVDKVHFSGKDSLLSGPAGGVVGAARTCMNIGFEKVIGFDMGGTSTDVSHYNGEYEIRDENIIAGVRVRTPVIDINTVAAGGGSVVSFDGQRFRVGPDSAGADPGPACYRKGGPLTITDCNLLLGRIQKDFFPRVFGPRADEPLDLVIVKAKFDDLLKLTPETIKSTEAIAWGFIEIAVEKMAQAIKKVTIERGYDIKDHVLSSFGGAGGQHACLIAERLGIRTVVIHPLAGVLSAVGIGLSDIKVIETKSIQKLLAESGNLERTFGELAKIAEAKIEKQVDKPFSINFRKKVLIRYQGSDTSLELPFNTISTMETSFHDIH